MFSVHLTLHFCLLLCTISALFAENIALITYLCKRCVRARVAGVPVTDTSVRLGASGRRFLCKAVLLFWTGDYPAQAKVSGTHDKTCHWCTMKSSHAPEISRRCWDGFRRYLPDNHPYRRLDRFGAPELRTAPPARTHAGFVADAKANEAWQGAKKDCPYKTTGVKELSPLCYLPLFCLIWDILPDLMHIIAGIWKRHIMEILKGKRAPAAVKPRKKYSDAENRRLQDDHKAVIDLLKSWKLTEEEGAILDRRSRMLGGDPDWIRNNLDIHSKSSTLTAHDWMRVIQDAGDYLFEGLFPQNPERLDALYQLVDATNLCLNATSAAESENRDGLSAVRLQVLEALCTFEAELPSTERAVMFHVLAHVPDAVYKWNSPRNYWCFFGERMMGHLIRFIHNRDLAVENIVTAYNRMRLVMGLLAVNPHKDTLVARLEGARCTLNKRSYLVPANQVCAGCLTRCSGLHFVISFH